MRLTEALDYLYNDSSPSKYTHLDHHGLTELRKEIRQAAKQAEKKSKPKRGKKGKARMTFNMFE